MSSAYRFHPPLPNRFLQTLFWYVNRYILSSDVTWKIDDRDLEHWKSIPPNSGILVAVKHAHFNDHFLVGEIADRVGSRCLYVSIPEAFEEYHGLGGFIIRRLGAFAVERGGVNIQATRYIVEQLVKGEKPLVIFPEGELHFLNDVVTPLKAGLALFALEGAKARKEAEKSGDVYILPIGIKYIYQQNITPLLENNLSKIEKIFSGSVKSGAIIERITRIQADILADIESRLNIKLPGFRDEERFQALSEHLVKELEMEEYKKNFEGTISDRARRLITHFKHENTKRLYWARCALYSLDFLPGYLDEPDQERTMETLRKLERFVTQHENPSFPGHRLLMAKIQEPIPVTPFLKEYLVRNTKRQALQRLTDAAQRAIQEGVDGLRQEAKAFSFQNSKLLRVKIPTS